MPPVSSYAVLACVNVLSSSGLGGCNADEFDYASVGAVVDDWGL
jgi:hypothetical protein